MVTSLRTGRTLPFLPELLNGTITTRSVCPYCGVGCGLKVESRLQEGGRLQVTSVKGDAGHPANAGALCSKGATVAEVLALPQRLLYPHYRTSRETGFERVGWNEALGIVAKKFRQIIAEHGPDAVAFYGSGQFLTEDYYVAQKLVKGHLGTNNFDANSRLCMSSAVAAYQQAFGQDGPPPSYADLDEADCIFISGANMAACHPILFNKIRSRKKREGEALRLIVADPRRTNTAAPADLYLPLKPGSDVALLNAMLYTLREEGGLDKTFIEAHTSGWAELDQKLAGYAPEQVEELTGLAAGQIRQAARFFGQARAALSLWSMGLNQSSAGVDKNRAIINLHLATGQLGRPGAGPFSLTGQPNAMGGREAGGLAQLLPGHRLVANPADRVEVETFWKVPAGSISPRPGLSAVELFRAVAEGRVKAIWIAATNPLASLPDLNQMRRALSKAELVVVQDAFFPTESGEYAHLLLPAAQWAEREGVMTNSERRLSLVERGADPPGEARPDWQIFAAFAQTMGFSGFDWLESREIFEEFKQLTRGRDLDMTGISYERLRSQSLQWPCPAPDHPGTPRLYQEKKFATPDGRARFGAVEFRPVAEPTDAEYPFLLTTGRVRDQWHTMSRTGHIPALLKVEAAPFLEINPEDAALLGLEEGQPVEVRSRRGQMALAARLNPAIRPGVVFSPFHWGKLFLKQPGGVCNDLTTPVYDPISKEPELKACAVSLKVLPDKIEECNDSSKL